MTGLLSESFIRLVGGLLLLLNVVEHVHDGAGDVLPLGLGEPLQGK